MTLKTTKEQRTALLIFIADPDVIIYDNVVRDLCHDAGRAEELEEEIKIRDKCAFLGPMRDCPTHGETEFLKHLRQENADLHAKLDRYTRIAESGKSYGDDLDNIERIGELELEATQDALDIERALSGQRLLYNRPLAVRAADLRTKLNAAYERAAQVCEEQICPCCWREDAHLATRQAAAAIRALKEQEKVG